MSGAQWNEQVTSKNKLKATKYMKTTFRKEREVLVTLLHVVDPESSKHDMLSYHDAITVEVEREERIKPISQILKEHQLPYHVVMLKGDPSKTIIDYANRTPYDLLVIGSRGLNTLQELLLGSVSHEVVQKATIPVLVVK